MSKYDEQYLDLVERILNEGYYDQNRTGIATYKLPHQILQFNLQEEFPILTRKCAHLGRMGNGRWNNRNSLWMGCKKI